MREEFLTECRLLLQQSLSRVGHCVGQLTLEQIWWCPGEGQNSIGIVIRHLAGNLRQWGVCGLTGQQDDRDRSSEFRSSLRQTPEQLLDLLESAARDVESVLARITTEDLLRGRTIQGFDVSGMGALMHTIPHFVGHTHQIVALTRMQLGDKYQFHWDPDGPRDVVPL